MHSDFDIHPFTAKAKRLFDIAVSLTTLLLASPALLVIALAIKLTSSGPIFFKQLRIGRALPSHTELFEIIKFRTMINDTEEATGATWAGKDDDRITYVGNFLRNTRLDGLPQLFNVLKGDMSIIGSRPERPGFYQRLEMAIPFFAERTYGVRPGITGLAQVNQGYDICIEDMRNKISFDHRYALALGNPFDWIIMDLSIIWCTFVIMLMGRG